METDIASTFSPSDPLSRDISTSFTMAVVEYAATIPEPLGKPVPNGARRPSARTRNSYPSLNTKASSSTVSSIPRTDPPPRPMVLSSLPPIQKMPLNDSGSSNGLRRRNPLPDVEDDDTDHDTQSTASQGSEVPPTYHRAPSSGFIGMRDRMKSPLMGSLKFDHLRKHISKNVEVKYVSHHPLPLYLGPKS